MKRHGLILTVFAASVATVACSGIAPRPKTGLEPIPTLPTRIADGDRQLRIGVLLPSSGPGEKLSQPLQRAIDLAVADINQAGGIWGRPLVTVRLDEGKDITSASSAMEQFLTEDPVDAVIGPASSRVALGLTDRIATQQMPTCSPLATASALSSAADNGYFFRTIPSDRLQAAALATAMDRTGAKTTSIVYPDDEYGRGFAEAVQADLARRSLQVQKLVEYDTAACDFRVTAARVFTATTPDAVAVIGSGETGANVLSTIRSTGGARVRTFVNDGLRGVGAMTSLTAANPTWLTSVEGVAVAATPGTSAWSKHFATATSGASALYAAYAYDCVNLIALAALASNSEAPARVASAVIQVSRGGQPCSTFTECASLLSQGRNIDLVGASGKLDLTDAGDTDSGTFDRFSFDPSGRDVTDPTSLDIG
jgi:branched-chain amino acid transport system substrate-binding protein